MHPAFTADLLQAFQFGQRIGDFQMISAMLADMGRQRYCELVIRVRDNGTGGADAGDGTGLVGLGDRVASLGGSMYVESPPGGPTILRAVLPCA